MNKVSTGSAESTIPVFKGVVTEVKRRRPAIVRDGRVKILVPRELILDGHWQHKFVVGAEVEGLFVFGATRHHQAVNIYSVA